LPLITVKRCTWQQFFQEWESRNETINNPFSKFTGGCTGTYASVNTYFGGLDKLIGAPRRYDPHESYKPVLVRVKGV